MTQNEFIQFTLNPDDEFGGSDGFEPGEENLDEELAEDKEEEEKDDLDDPDSDIEN